MKIEISNVVKKYMKISIFFILFCQLGFLLTKAGFFLTLAFGYIVGTLVDAVSQYLKDYRRERILDSALQEIENIEIIERNEEN